MILLHRPQPARSRTAPSAALAHFVAERGAVARGEAVLCALYWIDRERGPERATGEIGVTGHEITTLYPMHRGRRLGATSQVLASLARAGLVAPRSEGGYGITPLGRAVVEVLPDADAAARIRGVRVRRAPLRERLRD